jgi:hypothetical protein
MAQGTWTGRFGRLGFWSSTVVCAAVAPVLLVVLSGEPALADETAPTTAAASAAATVPAAAPARLGAAKTDGKKGGLAAFAAKAELKGAGSGEGKITISNGTLAQTSDNGTLSVGGGVSAGAAPGAGKEPASDVPGEPTAAEKWGKSFDEQQKKIAGMEKDLAAFDKQVSDGTDPYYDNNIQNRAPGQVDPNLLTRQRAQQEIEAEKAKLEEMRRQARRDGVDTRSK